VNTRKTTILLCGFLFATAASFAAEHPIRFVRATLHPETHSVVVEWEGGAKAKDVRAALAELGAVRNWSVLLNGARLPMQGVDVDMERGVVEIILRPAVLSANDPGEFPKDVMSVLYLPRGATVRVPTGQAAH